MTSSGRINKGQSMAAAEPKPEPTDQSAEKRDAGLLTPSSLLDGLRANEPAAWQRLLSLYRPLVIFWCGRGGLHGPDAEDLAQEVFAAAAAGLPDFRHDRPGDTFRGWLRSIARNHIALHIRRNLG